MSRTYVKEDRLQHKLTEWIEIQTSNSLEIPEFDPGFEPWIWSIIECKERCKKYWTCELVSEFYKARREFENKRQLMIDTDLPERKQELQTLTEKTTQILERMRKHFRQGYAILKNTGSSWISE